MDFLGGSSGNVARAIFVLWHAVNHRGWQFLVRTRV